MSQVSPVESLPQSSSTQPLSPTLQAALSCLDVQLEEELTRYRRRPDARRKLMSIGSQGRPQTNKTLDLISVKVTGGRTQTPAANIAMPESLPVANGDRDREPIPEVEAMNPQLHLPTGVATSADLPLDESETAYLNYSQAAVPATNPLEPDDYLESSEALLNDLAEEEAEERAIPAKSESSSSNGLLGPLGVGSMLLLLLASAIWGYVAMNPSSVSHLSLDRLFGSRTSTTANNPATPSDPTSTTAASAPKVMPSSPDLASQEFEELDLMSLSTLEPKSAPTSQPSARTSPQAAVNPPAPLPNPASVPIDLPGTLLPRPSQSGVLPPALPTQGSVPAAKPSPASAQAGKKPATVQGLVLSNQPSPAAAKPKPAKENRYLVVATYSGDRSLKRAKAIAPNAFVRRLPPGNRIQLAAFPSEADAKNKVAELRKKGISTRIYRR